MMNTSKLYFFVTKIYLFNYLFLQLGLMDLGRQTFFMVKKDPHFFCVQFGSNYNPISDIHFATLFFSLVAIRFVLSDLFQNLRSEDRQALLHVWHSSSIY